MTATTLLLMLLVQGAGPPIVPQPNDPAAVLGARIYALERQMDTDLAGAAEALDSLATDSIELRKTRPLSAAERTVHSRLFVLRARAHIQLLDNAKAGESLLELLRVDPRFAGDLAPRERELFDAVRSKDGGVLEVGSREPGARVLVDGVEVGFTADVPVRVSLVTGTYEVRLEKAGFKPAVTRATVTAGETLGVTELALERNVPPLVFLTDRDGVDVVADNVALGRTLRLAALRQQVSPAESAGIDRALAASGLDPQSVAGILMRQPPIDRSMTIRFQRACFIDETRTLAVTTEALAQLEPEQPILWFGDQNVARLRPDVGTLRVASTPADADVFLDGQLAGRTPFDREVCSGARRVRVRHRIGSYDVAVTITRGRTEVIDVALKPDLAFLGAIDNSTGAPQSSPQLTSLIDRALASTVTAFHLAARVDLPPEVTRWSDASHAELLTAVESNDAEGVARLLRQASANYDAPLLLSAVRHPAAAGQPSAVDLLLFWSDHAVFDRVRVSDLSEKAVASALAPLNEPGSTAALVQRTVLGMRLADTGIPGHATGRGRRARRFACGDGRDQTRRYDRDRRAGPDIRGAAGGPDAAAAAGRYPDAAHQVRCSRARRADPAPAPAVSGCGIRCDRARQRPDRQAHRGHPHRGGRGPRSSDLQPRAHVHAPGRMASRPRLAQAADHPRGRRRRRSRRRAVSTRRDAWSSSAIASGPWRCTRRRPAAPVKPWRKTDRAWPRWRGCGSP